MKFNILAFYFYLGSWGGLQCPSIQVAPVGPPTKRWPLLHWNIICRLFLIFLTYGRYSYKPIAPTSNTFPFSTNPGNGQNTIKRIMKNVIRKSFFKHAIWPNLLTIPKITFFTPWCHSSPISKETLGCVVTFQHISITTFKFTDHTMVQLWSYYHSILRSFWQFSTFCWKKR